MSLHYRFFKLPSDSWNAFQNWKYALRIGQERQKQYYRSVNTVSSLWKQAAFEFLTEANSDRHIKKMKYCMEIEVQMKTEGRK